MTIEELANAAVDLCESLKTEYMVTGALAFNYYGISRSTKDVDLVINGGNPTVMPSIIDGLKPDNEFAGQVQFDTITWGKRHMGRPVGNSAISIELFELFDDPFVMAQFGRQVMVPSRQLGRRMPTSIAERPERTLSSLPEA